MPVSRLLKKGFDFLSRSNLSHDLDLTVDGQCWCHHHAEACDLADIGDLLHFGGEREFLNSLLGILLRLIEKMPSAFFIELPYALVTVRD